MAKVIKDDAWLQKQRVWRHNSYLGMAAMMQANCNSMLNSDSTTVAAKSIAQEIHDLIPHLQRELKTRIDPK